MKTFPAKRSLEKTKAFSRDVKKLPHHIVEAGWKVAQTLQDNIFAPELDMKKWKGMIEYGVLQSKRLIVYTFDTSKIYLLRFAHRKEIYRLNNDWD